MTGLKLGSNVLAMKIKTETLRAERLALGLTQESLANRAGVTRSTVQYAERGISKRMATIEKIAGALGLDPLDIAVAESDVETKALHRIREMQAAS